MRKTWMRGAALAAVVSVALVQGCAGMTGMYVADRAPVASRSMLSRYDVLHYRSSTLTPATGSALHMPAAAPPGAYFFLVH